MKLITALLLLPALALAQTAPKPKPAAARPHAAATSSAATHGCVTLPALSPKIPALPAGAPCAKHLYTISTVPSVKLENVSPMEGTGLAERLDILPSSFSLDYIDFKTGAGELAQPNKYYTLNYVGYLADGTVFDSSAIQGQSFTFKYGEHQVIAGWDTGLNGMRIGGKRRLFIPFQLAYGPNGRAPKIPAKAELIFDVELVAQGDKPPTLEAKPIPPPPGAPTSVPVPPATPPATTTPPQ